MSKPLLRHALLGVAFGFVVTACYDQDPPAKAAGMVVFRGADPAQLWSANIDGLEAQRIVIGTITVAPAHAVPYYPELNLTHEDQIAFVVDAAFSPDGARLLLNVSRGFDQSQLIVVDRDGANARTASEQLWFIAGAAWSPDSSKVAYIRTTQGGDPHVMVIDLATDEITDVGLASHCDAMVWDTAGTGLYCSRDNGTLSTVTRFDIATQATQVIHDAIPGIVTSIAADGDHVLVRRLIGNYQQRLVRRRCSDARELTVHEGSDSWYGEFLYAVNRVVVPDTSGQLPAAYYAELESQGSLAGLESQGLLAGARAVRLTPIGTPTFLDFYPE